jgi:hypothetical protein
MSPTELSEMFANVLQESKNGSLEVFVGTFYVGLNNRCDETIWEERVLPILEFNGHRRLFQGSAVAVPAARR